MTWAVMANTYLVYAVHQDRRENLTLVGVAPLEVASVQPHPLRAPSPSMECDVGIGSARRASLVTCAHQKHIPVLLGGGTCNTQMTRDEISHQHSSLYD